MTEKICYTIERHVSGISLAGTTEYAPVAQLDRALDSDSKGRWFESSRAYQHEKRHASACLFSCWYGFAAQNRSPAGG